jgi:hypothetical protein
MGGRHVESRQPVDGVVGVRDAEVSVGRRGQWAAVGEVGREEHLVGGVGVLFTCDNAGRAGGLVRVRCMHPVYSSSAPSCASQYRVQEADPCVRHGILIRLHISAQLLTGAEGEAHQQVGVELREVLPNEGGGAGVVCQVLVAARLTWLTVRVRVRVRVGLGLGLGLGLESGLESGLGSGLGLRLRLGLG